MFTERQRPLEAEGKDCEPGARREEQAKPLLDRFKTWLDEQADA